MTDEKKPESKTVSKTVMATGTAAGGSSTGTVSVPVSVQPPATHVEFEVVSEEVTRAHVPSNDVLGKAHVGTITKHEGTVTFYPTVHVFLSLAELREIVAFMERP